MVLISIEGNIGSGKSTLIKKIKEKYPNVVVIDEPVDEWTSITDDTGVNILERYYADQNRWAFTFQMMAFITRARRLRGLLNEPIYVTERSVFTDREVFAKMLRDSGKIHELEYLIYLRWFNDLSWNIKVDHTIYIDTPPEVCHSRVLSRARPGENISLDYLKECHRYHEEWLSKDESKIVNPDDQKLDSLLAPRLCV